MIVPPCLVLMWLGRNRLDPAVDRLSIGFRGKLLDRRTGLVKLSLRRPGLTAALEAAYDPEAAGQKPEVDLDIEVH